MALRILDEDEELNPILSVVNLVDLFVVIVAALLIVIALNPLNPFNDDEVIIVKNPNSENMEIIIKDAEKMEKYKATDQMGKGEGTKAGVAYRLKDGSFVYVPE
ncbi:MAG TPA: DUF2149 domain-containing protein [Gammaproteobacteria bacterium]|jgi:hypothetical protein|nr:hypothetical protein [Chromatiales bacterium]MCP4926205.1 DUF2149 domain-containing protein [Gammaproteobacteria bacterium]HJP38308.1 DUF2149 domain-containing protein [Gammaproteobacteria bacterium]